jgi:hypothetical protein
MDEEEPAWRAELREAIHRWDPYETEAPLRMKGGLLDTVLPHIKAAEQRGRREALAAFVCGACGRRVGWIDCPTGGWWAHEVHPGDDHDATECVPESESP